MTPYQFLQKNKKKRMDDLFTFLKIPSVSAKSEHKKDLASCANWVRDEFKKIGFKTKVYPTKGHPIVYAEYLVDPKLPTALYYGHYDVQPAEPFNLWKSPPFKPVIRAGNIVARGSADDKGQVFCHMKGLEAILKSDGTLPINVKFLVEGEEEIASENLPAFIKKNKKMLKADIVVVSDSSMYDKNTPAVTYGLRGIAPCELFVYGPNKDLHSGSYGGAVANPINILCQIVGQLHDKNGKIAVPGFYSEVKPVTAFDKAQVKKVPFSEKEYKKEVGVDALGGEKKYHPKIRTGSRPTLDVNGITGGYQGEGSKTIIPSFASCKITMRLVPDMDPNKIIQKLEKYIKKLAPKSVRIKLVNMGGGGKAISVPTDGPYLEAASKAIKTGFKADPVFLKEGGSIPIVGDFKSILGLDTLLIGLCQPDCNAHSPNEKFRVKDFENGCKTAVALPYELAKVKK